ncbi:MAG TPA: hypothetical protein VGB55_00295 [Tepidisphaeraceae bacterium]|jgi:HTH-type transcriptional regulator/antitoxin HigA
MPKFNTTRAAAILPTTYSDLFVLLPLRPIHDRVGLDNATELAGALALLPKPTRDQADYLEVLSTLIEAYEAEHEAIVTAGVPSLDLLKHVLDANEMTASDLGRLLGDRTIGAKILSGQRKLSKTHILTLSERFKMRAEAFLR